MQWPLLCLTLSFLTAAKVGEVGARMSFVKNKNSAPSIQAAQVLRMSLETEGQTSQYKLGWAPKSHIGSGGKSLPFRDAEPVLPIQGFGQGSEDTYHIVSSYSGMLKYFKKILLLISSAGVITYAGVCAGLG